MEIINKFLNKDGKIRLIPKKNKNKLVIFDYVVNHISKNGTVFSEQEINMVIKQVYEDYATMRRYLVDYNYLIRDNYGTEYRLGMKR
ncbi:DUF2087 domain-containing protein [Facklamia sp. DSM 111018]|uniref:DUF2087 domain-containing protein n=1 Tax=Facklamia lactis TaxID=2749967 RepID=A0ABS0LT49_9LACT|nr:DUF2087 domain-containing protein [Facklamia lactis]MBG9987337.1 DUF2087 domain-containing protein [Facklamia lactis]